MKQHREGSRATRIGLIISAIVGLGALALAWSQVEAERRIDLEDVDRRARVLAHHYSLEIAALVEETDVALADAARVRVDGYNRLLGFGLYRPNGTVLAAATAFLEFESEMVPLVLDAADGRERRHVIRERGPPVHVLMVPLRGPDQVIRAVVAVLHDIAYVDERAVSRMIHFTLWIGLLLVVVLVSVRGATWLAYERPLRSLATWMQRLRLENAVDAPPSGLPVDLLRSESDRLAASYRAVRSAVRESSRSDVRAERVWTRERLRAHAFDCLSDDQQLVVVSNREPYMHQYHGSEAKLIIPAGGLVTALDPVLRACGGVWVAHGAGDADRDTADADGHLGVPPHDPRYALRRVWMSREEEQGYYYGFSNEGLWPLCHLAHERPVFLESDWLSYVKVNQRFADAVLEEVGSGRALVLVQDYQLALVPAMIKSARPDLSVGLFWHIPWPNPEAFRICPWREQILRGMLGADLVGFHLQQYCNNFLDTVDRMVEARLDWDHFAVDFNRKTTLVRPFPISVQGWGERTGLDDERLAERIVELRHRHGVDAPIVAVSVDRVDYTKGLPERFRAIARFLEKYPQYLEAVTFVQLAAPSRTHIRRYREHLAEIEALADEINWKFQTEGWKPIHLMVDHHDAETVYAYMRMASVGIVSSLHDGMNLVAKEYIVAKQDDGVLILSEFAGAARELSDALIINPYDVEQFAEAIRIALEMSEAERRARMLRLARNVEENNIYRWAAGFISELSATQSSQAAGAAANQ